MKTLFGMLIMWIGAVLASASFIVWIVSLLLKLLVHVSWITPGILIWPAFFAILIGILIFFMGSLLFFIGEK